MAIPRNWPEQDLSRQRDTHGAEGHQCNFGSLGTHMPVPAVEPECHISGSRRPIRLIELRGAKGIRTPDPLDANEAPTIGRRRPTLLKTSTSTAARSNALWTERSKKGAW